MTTRTTTASTKTSDALTPHDAESASRGPLTVKAARLGELLAGYRSVLIAFSGGVDSAYLAITAHQVLGDRALAVTADSPSYPDTHRQLALSIARQFGFAHDLIRTAELERPEYRANPANRCYYCKDELYSQLAARPIVAAIVGIIAVDHRGKPAFAGNGRQLRIQLILAVIAAIRRKTTFA